MRLHYLVDTDARLDLRGEKCSRGRVLVDSGGVSWIGLFK